MSWTVWADVYDSALGTSIYARFSPGKNIYLRGMRATIISVGSPTYTSLNAKLYSDASNQTPGILIATSTDSRTKAELQSLDHAIIQTYFTFDDVPLQEHDNYHLVIDGVGYSPTASSYLGWRKAWPDPIYSGSFTASSSNIDIAPYDYSIIGGEP